MRAPSPGRDKSPDPSDRPRLRRLRRSGPLSTGHRTLGRVPPRGSGTDLREPRRTRVRGTRPGHAATGTSARNDGLLGGTRQTLSRPPGPCQPGADQRIRAYPQGSRGRPGRGVSRPILLSAACPATTRRATGPVQTADAPGAQERAGTTTTPVAVVATIGSSRISAADAEVSGRPRPTTTARKPSVRDRVPTLSTSAVISSRSPARTGLRN